MAKKKTQQNTEPKERKTHISFTIMPKRPRGVMPPPTKKFLDKRKDNNKNWCREKGSDE